MKHLHTNNTVTRNQLKKSTSLEHYQSSNEMELTDIENIDENDLQNLKGIVLFKRVLSQGSTEQNSKKKIPMIECS